jgi:transposase
MLPLHFTVILPGIDCGDAAVTTIRNHLDGICNYFLNRTTSGVMEGIDNRLKVIKRQAYGFVGFDNFRDRLLACFPD